MNFKQALDYVSSLGHKGHKPTLDRMNYALERLGPKNKFKVIHIAGTNGKGSVCAYVSAALKSAGYKTGLFISPHIFDIRERIGINGEKISESDFARLIGRVSEISAPLTAFECLTLVAFMYFNEMNVEVAVLETGLGGRFDATNTANNKIITAITKIGLDHEKILGDTEEKIAAEKCGIITTDKTVCSNQEKPSVLNVIKNHSKKLIIPETGELSNVNVSYTGNRFTYKGETYETRMGGHYQIENALTAIEILENCGLNIKTDDIKQGLKSAFMPARMQVVSKKPLIIVDGAHNPDGAGELLKTMEENPGFTAIVGFMRDKDYERVLSGTLKKAGKVICVTAYEGARSLSAKELYNTAKKYNDNCSYSSDLKAALETALAEDKPAFVFGSLYLAANVLKILGYDN